MDRPNVANVVERLRAHDIAHRVVKRGIKEIKVITATVPGLNTNTFVEYNKVFFASWWKSPLPTTSIVAILSKVLRAA
ncbi:hypothetical protein PRIC1_005055 [Phytophthora ramorum]